jgi:hypothetical protein
MDLFKVITKRTIALIILRVSGTLAGGSIAGVELWQAALLAAFIGVMDVAESLSRSYVVDGELSTDEINTAFASSAEAELAKTKTVDVAPVAAVAAVAVAAPALFDVEEEEEEEFDFDEEEDDK